MHPHPHPLHDPQPTLVFFGILSPLYPLRPPLELLTVALIPPLGIGGPFFPTPLHFLRPKNELAPPPGSHFVPFPLPTSHYVDFSFPLRIISLGEQIRGQLFFSRDDLGLPAPPGSFPQFTERRWGRYLFAASAVFPQNSPSGQAPIKIRLHPAFLRGLFPFFPQQVTYDFYRLSQQLGQKVHLQPVREHPPFFAFVAPEETCTLTVPF